MRPLAVALTGSIAAGKSEALQAFARHGAATVSSDALVHELYRDDAELQAALRDRWGDAVFADGEVDRAAIGRIVFADRDELAWLEAELHPRVRAATADWLARQTAEVAVAEIPLLFETGGESRFDKVVVITAPAEVRIRAPRGARRPRGAARARGREGAPRRFRVRQRRHARGSRRVRRGSPRGADGALRRWLAAVAVVAAAIGVFFYLQKTEPAWYARLWYPLQYDNIVRQYAHEQQLDPALLAAVIETESKFDADARSSAGAVGLCS